MVCRYENFIFSPGMEHKTISAPHVIHLFSFSKVDVEYQIVSSYINNLMNMKSHLLWYAESVDSSCVLFVMPKLSDMLLPLKRRQFRDSESC
eukprot:1158542-Pelagomonas_calceolata.AAC.7